MTGFWGAVAALLPPIGVGLIFWFVMRAIVQADRRERAAMARLEAAEDAAGREAAAPGGQAADDAAVDPDGVDAAGSTQSRAPRVEPRED